MHFTKSLVPLIIHFPFVISSYNTILLLVEIFFLALNKFICYKYFFHPQIKTYKYFHPRRAAGKSIDNSLTQNYQTPVEYENPASLPKFISRGQSYRAVIGDTINLPCVTQDLGENENEFNGWEGNTCLPFIVPLMKREHMLP